MTERNGKSMRIPLIGFAWWLMSCSNLMNAHQQPGEGAAAQLAPQPAPKSSVSDFFGEIETFNGIFNMPVWHETNAKTVLARVRGKNLVIWIKQKFQDIARFPAGHPGNIFPWDPSGIVPAPYELWATDDQGVSFFLSGPHWGYAYDITVSAPIRYPADEESCPPPNQLGCPPPDDYSLVAVGGWKASVNLPTGSFVNVFRIEMPGAAPVATPTHSWLTPANEFLLSLSFAQDGRGLGFIVRKVTPKPQHPNDTMHHEVSYKAYVKEDTLGALGWFAGAAQVEKVFKKFEITTDQPWSWPREWDYYRTEMYLNPLTFAGGHYQHYHLIFVGTINGELDPDVGDTISDKTTPAPNSPQAWYSIVADPSKGVIKSKEVTVSEPKPEGRHFADVAIVPTKFGPVIHVFWVYGGKASPNWQFQDDGIEDSVGTTAVYDYAYWYAGDGMVLYPVSSSVINHNHLGSFLFNPHYPKRFSAEAVGEDTLVLHYQTGNFGWDSTQVSRFFIVKLLDTVGEPLMPNKSNYKAGRYEFQAEAWFETPDTIFPGLREGTLSEMTYPTLESFPTWKKQIDRIPLTTNFLYYTGAAHILWYGFTPCMGMLCW